MFIPIIMGSESDRSFAEKIAKKLDELEVPYNINVASAHKDPLKVLDIIKQYEDDEKICFITIAGRSNALSGFVAANSKSPTIACPPFSDKADYLVNIHSSLQMPSNAPAMTVIDPGNAALAATRILKN